MLDDDALFRLRLPRRPESVSAARKALAALNGDLHLVSQGRLRDVQLMTSELVTNAIRHSHNHVSVVVHAREHRTAGRGSQRRSGVRRTRTAPGHLDVALDRD